MGSILHHIMPLVINSLGGRHLHTQTHIPTLADKAVLRNPGLKMTYVQFISLKVSPEQRQQKTKMNLHIQ